MKRGLITALVLLAFYALFLVVTAPARLVVRYWQSQLPPRMVVAAVQGSIWSGRAALWVDHGGARRLLTDVRFRFWPAALLRGEWGYTVHCQGPLHGHAVLAVGRQTLTVAALSLTTPVAALSPLVPALKDWGLSGALTLTSPHLHVGATAVGGGQLVWAQAGVVSLPVAPLGSYVLTFTMTPMGLRYRVRTRHGKLQVQGGGHYRLAGGVVTFHGLVRGHGLRLSGFMSSFGTAAAHGARAITLRIPVATL
ncbi:MAG: type II secretion system protein N [Acidiferrobacter sp.]